MVGPERVRREGLRPSTTDVGACAVARLALERA